MAAIIFPGRNLFYFWTRSGCIPGRDGSEGAVYPLTWTLRRKDQDTQDVANSGLVLASINTEKNGLKKEYTQSKTL